MPLKEGSSLRNLDAQAKKETEADNSVINMETHEESSDPLSEKESEKGYSKRDTDPRQAVEPASNEKTIPVQPQQDQKKPVWRNSVK